MNKKTFYAIVAVIIVAGITAALVINGVTRPGAAPDDGVRIGVCVYTGGDTLVSSIYSEIQQAASNFENATGVQIYVSSADARESQSVQDERIDRFIALGYDVLCVNLVDRTDAAQIIDKAREAGIPVVFFNREPVTEDLLKWDELVYVGSDARTSAELQAHIIKNAYSKDPSKIDLNGDGVIQYVMLEGESRHQDALIRTEAVITALKASGLETERLGGGIANWSRAQAQAIAESCFNQFGDDIELIICNNDDMALGAMDAAEKLGRRFTNIVGIDGTEQGLDAVRRGKLLGTVDMRISEHGKSIFKLAYALATGGDIYAAANVDGSHCVRVGMNVVEAPEE